MRGFTFIVDTPLSEDLVDQSKQSQSMLGVISEAGWPAQRAWGGRLGEM